MSRRYYRRKDNFENIFLDFLEPFLVILVFVLVGWILTHKEQAKLYGIIAIIIVIVAVILYFVLKKRREDTSFSFNDEEILYMLKGMPPQQFEIKVAGMFNKLGYKAKVTGGANDGGIDVIAYKDGKKYYVQCKKFITREVTPHDVRDFLGAITNVNNPAEKGFFITTGNFTLMAEKAAEENPRIELIDGIKLIEYYKLAYKKDTPEIESTQPPQPPLNN
ncbi:MAG TPA: restriction endonuclease [Candidatus Paceibacterota bacterium]|nr:restriction endonuclease [Candidatus Paceibacterota bacterium]